MKDNIDKIDKLQERINKAILDPKNKNIKNQLVKLKKDLEKHLNKLNNENNKYQAIYCSIKLGVMDNKVLEWGTHSYSQSALLDYLGSKKFGGTIRHPDNGQMYTIEQGGKSGLIARDTKNNIISISQDKEKEKLVKKFMGKIDKFDKELNKIQKKQQYKKSKLAKRPSKKDKPVVRQSNLNKINNQPLLNKKQYSDKPLIVKLFIKECRKQCENLTQDALNDVTFIDGLKPCVRQYAKKLQSTVNDLSDKDKKRLDKIYRKNDDDSLKITLLELGLSKKNNNRMYDKILKKKVDQINSNHNDIKISDNLRYLINLPGWESLDLRNTAKKDLCKLLNNKEVLQDPSRSDAIANYIMQYPSQSERQDKTKEIILKKLIKYELDLDPPKFTQDEINYIDKYEQKFNRILPECYRNDYDGSFKAFINDLSPNTSNNIKSSDNSENIISIAKKNAISMFGKSLQHLDDKQLSEVMEKSIDGEPAIRSMNKY